MAEEYCSPHLRSFTNNIVVAYVVDNQPIQDGILERSLPAPTRALRGRRPQPLPPPFPLQGKFCFTSCQSPDLNISVVHPNRAFLANVLQRFINSELVMMTDTNWNEMVLASRIAKAEAKKKRRAEKLTKERRRGLLARPKYVHLVLPIELIVSNLSRGGRPSRTKPILRAVIRGRLGRLNQPGTVVGGELRKEHFVRGGSMPIRAGVRGSSLGRNEFGFLLSPRSSNLHMPSVKNNVGFPSFQKLCLPIIKI